MKISSISYGAELSGKFYRRCKEIASQHDVISQKPIFTIENAVNISNQKKLIIVRVLNLKALHRLCSLCQK
jgi:hypothetical protein